MESQRVYSCYWHLESYHFGSFTQGELGCFDQTNQLIGIEWNGNEAVTYICVHTHTSFFYLLILYACLSSRKSM